MSDDGTVTDTSAMSQWARVWNAGGKKTGRTFEVYDLDLQQKGMENAGFVDVTVKEFYIPVGVWHKDKELAEKGLWWKFALESDLEGMEVLQTLPHLSPYLCEWGGGCY